MNLSAALQARANAEQSVAAARAAAEDDKLEFEKRSQLILQSNNLLEALSHYFGGVITPVCTTKELTDKAWYLDLLFRLGDTYLFYYCVSYDFMGYDWIRISIPKIVESKTVDYVDFDGITLSFELYEWPRGSKVPCAFLKPIRQEQIVEEIQRRARYFTMRTADEIFKGKTFEEFAVERFMRKNSKAIDLRSN